LLAIKKYELVANFGDHSCVIVAAEFIFLTQPDVLVWLVCATILKSLSRDGILVRRFEFLVAKLV